MTGQRRECPRYSRRLGCRRGVCGVAGPIGTPRRPRATLGHPGTSPGGADLRDCLPGVPPAVPAAGPRRGARRCRCSRAANRSSPNWGARSSVANPPGCARPQSSATSASCAKRTNSHRDFAADCGAARGRGPHRAHGVARGSRCGTSGPRWPSPFLVSAPSFPFLSSSRLAQSI